MGEIPDPLTEPSATIRWEPTAILVHAIPRDVNTGNSTLLGARRQRELETVRHKLKVKPNDQELLGRLQKLSYSGLVGHAGGVTAISGSGDPLQRRIITAGADSRICVWEVDMLERPTVRGVLGATRNSEGEHRLKVLKELAISDARPLVNISQPDEGSIDPIDPQTITSLHWVGARVAMGSTSNMLFEVVSVGLSVLVDPTLTASMELQFIGTFQYMRQSRWTRR